MIKVMAYAYISDVEKAFASWQQENPEAKYSLHYSTIIFQGELFHCVLIDY